MKSIKVYFHKFGIQLIGLLLLNSCEAPMFSEPPPENEKNLRYIPGKLQGNFLSDDSNSILIISSQLMVRNYDFDVIIDKSELDSTDSIAGDELINKFTNEKQKIDRIGDSLLIHIRQSDTIFELKNGNLLRHFRNYYFLNRKEDENHWFVRSIYFNKGILKLSRVLHSEDAELLQEITGRNDSNESEFSLSKKQWHEFYSDSKEINSETFKKLK